MYFELKCDGESITGVVIRPEERENEDLLHNYANTLKVKNAAISFSDMAKAGLFNDMSDDQYRSALEKIKTIGTFFDNKREANVFHLLAEAINYILQLPDPGPGMNKKEMSEETGGEEADDECEVDLDAMLDDDDFFDMDCLDEDFDEDDFDEVDLDVEDPDEDDFDPDDIDGDDIDGDDA